MAQQSKIQWTDATWNPWHGCKKVSPGCKFCYMYRDKGRYGQDATKVLRSTGTFDAPIKWANEVRKLDLFNQGPRPDDTPFPGMKVFTCSWSDFFIEEADQWRPEAWEVIRRTPEFTYQILTKRPHRIAQCLPPDWGQGYKNVWLGVSIESGDQTSRAIILDEDVPAAVKFASLEPLLSGIGLGSTFFSRFDWIIIGGESGNETGKYKYRPCDLRWIKGIIEMGEWCSVPIFVKQLGTHLAKEMALKDRHGGDWDEWPEWLRLREFPATKNQFQL